MSHFFCYGDGNVLELGDGHQFLCRHVCTTDPLALSGWSGTPFQMKVWRRAGFDAAWGSPAAVGPAVGVSGSNRRGSGIILCADGLLVAGPVNATDLACYSADMGATWSTVAAGDPVYPQVEPFITGGDASPRRLGFRETDDQVCFALGLSTSLYAGKAVGSSAMATLEAGGTDGSCDPGCVPLSDGAWDVAFVADYQFHHWRSRNSDGLAPWALIYSEAVTSRGLLGTQFLQLYDGRLVLVGVEQAGPIYYRKRTGNVVAYVGERTGDDLAQWTGPFTIGSAGAGYQGMYDDASAYGPGDTDPYVLDLPTGTVEVGWAEGDGTVKRYQADSPDGTWTEVPS